MTFAGRSERIVVAGLVVCLAVAGLVAYSVRSTGYSARHVELNDGGIWVASDHDGLFGRANLPAGSLDAAFAPKDTDQPNFQLSVMQDAAGVVARDSSTGQLFPVDVSNGELLTDNGLAVSNDAQVAIGGGTIAVLDPDVGKIWALRFDTASGLTNLDGLGGKATPVARIGVTGGVGRQSALTVGTDGTVRALSGAKGAAKLAVVRPRGAAFAAPEYRSLDADLPAPQITAVGDSTVVFDASVGQLLLPGGKVVTLPDRDQGAKIQSAGPPSGQVLVATPANLYSVDLSSGRFTSISAAGTGAPSAPVVVGTCVYASWAGTPGAAVRGCDGADPKPVALQNQRVLQSPQLQVNRNTAVLNDLVGGGVWDLSDGREIDNWSQVRPTDPKPKPSTKSRDKSPNLAQSKPKAVPDSLGARPGRTAILHVLDNDSDPAGRILTISSVSQPDNTEARLDISPDGQTVQIAMPATGSVVHFTYTVDDNVGLRASAKVTVQAHPLPANKAPRLRKMPAHIWTVPYGGKLSLPVIGDWRDDDGDPPVLAGATATAGRVSTTPDGRIDYIAPAQAGPQKVSYQITDTMAATTGYLNITVLKANAANTVPATAEPDVARGQVGKPIIIHPLDNDLPGADPANPDAQLRIAAKIPDPDGVTVATDTQSGTVTVTATQQKNFVFSYTVAYGGAAYARGSVRVNIDGPQSKTPIAVLDTVSLHGQQPVTADVLSNDFDPAGGLLVVQHAEAANAQSTDPQLQVAIIQGRYLRINALKPKLDQNPELINYTVTNGIKTVVGQVSVSQLPMPTSDVPVPQDDYATVRAGDSTAVPVLDNDTAPSGDTLTLVTNVEGAPGPGLLDTTNTSGAPGGIGRAYVSANVLRYVAPSTVRTETGVTVDYVVTNSAGDQATGHLFVTIEPPPSANRPDQAPTPPEIDVRVVAGDTVMIPIRTTNTDPDGDAVTLVGVAGGPALGRVLGSTASSLRYQAYPSSKNSGTDTFGYTVTDRYGQTGRNNVRVAVVQPGDPQPPVAADLSVTAAPGRVVSVDALAAAFKSPDDRVTLLPLKRNNSTVPGNASIRTEGAGPILVTAPSSAVPVELRYSVSSGLTAPSAATITVRSQKGIDLPPVAFDDYAAPAAERTVVTVDPLARAYDPDSPDTPDLRVTRVFAPTAKVVTSKGDAGKIEIEVTGQPQIVPYEIADAGGAVATASVFVPAAGAGAPYAKPGQQITVARDATKVVAATSYAIDPAGKTLRLGNANSVSASPASALKVSLDGATGLTLTALGHYTGPAAITFQVTDGRSVTDPNGATGVITVPVQIGPETPVLRCTSSPLTTIQGGATLDIDVTSLCHVWVANASTLDTIQYVPSWQGGQSPDGVSFTGSGSKTLHVAARGTATPGQKGSLTVRVGGNDAVIPGILNVLVAAAPSPTVQPVTLSGVRAGTSVTVDLADYTSSPLVDKAIAVVRPTFVSQTAATRVNGSMLTITPARTAKGTIVLDVVITDTAARPDVTARQATGRLTVHVLGAPDAPTDVTPDRSLLSEQADLSWNAPSNNGLPITSYEVSWNGGQGQQNCPASPCTIRNLTNGQVYRFTVRARNAVGFGRSSAQSGPAQPNARPEAPTGGSVTNVRDQKLTLTWQAAKVNGTDILYYLVSWPGHRLKPTGLTTEATGLDNNAKTVFTIQAVNKAGAGPGLTVKGQSSGKPQYPAPPAAPQPLPAPKAAPVDAGDHQSVTLRWPATNANGPGPVTYVVTRTPESGDPAVLCTTKALTCDDDKVPNDGSTVRYSYVAKNGTGNTSQASAAASVLARGRPQGIDTLSAQPTGTDNMLSISFVTKPVYDKSMIVNCTVVDGGSCGTWSYSGGTSGHTESDKTINVNRDGQVNIRLEQCNTQNTCSSTVQTASATAYGRIGKPTIVSPHGSGPYLDFGITYNTHGAPIRVHVIIGKRNRGLLDSGCFDSDTDSVLDQTYTLSDPDAADHTMLFTESGSPGADGTPGAGPPVYLGSDQEARIAVSLGDAGNGFDADKRGSGGLAGPVCGDNNSQPYTGHVTVDLHRGGRDGCADKDTSCGHPHLTLTGFQASGQVTCSFAAKNGPTPAPVMLMTNGDGSVEKDLDATYNTANATLTATCGGLTGNDYNWPG